MAQQPTIDSPTLVGFLDKICFFSEDGLSHDLDPPLHKGLNLPYPGFKPGTFGYQVGIAATEIRVVVV
jgi:hypothetical protein